MVLTSPTSFEHMFSNLMQVFSHGLVIDKDGLWQSEILADALGAGKVQIFGVQGETSKILFKNMEHMPKYFDEEKKVECDYYSIQIGLQIKDGVTLLVGRIDLLDWKLFSAQNRLSFEIINKITSVDWLEWQYLDSSLEAMAKHASGEINPNANKLFKGKIINSPFKVDILYGSNKAGMMSMCLMGNNYNWPELPNKIEPANILEKFLNRFKS